MQEKICRKREKGREKPGCERKMMMLYYGGMK
jgi:hypothetical protein